MVIIWVQLTVDFGNLEMAFYITQVLSIAAMFQIKVEKDAYLKNNEKVFGVCSTQMLVKIHNTQTIFIGITLVGKWVHIL